MKGSNRYIVWSLFVYLLWVAGYAVYSYRSEKKDLYMELDRQLEDAARTVSIAVPPDLHHRGMSEKDVSPEQDMEMIKRLSKYTKGNHIVYIYTLILRENKIYFTSSNATEEELESRQGLVHYFDYYDDVDPRVFDIFKTRKKTFLEYTDKWGTFRSVFLPTYSRDGTFYLSVADHSLEYIQKSLNYHVIHTFVVSLLFILFAYPIYLASVNRATQQARLLEVEVKNRTKELFEAKKEAEIQARTDVLTGLNNRRAFFEYLSHVNGLSKRHGRTYSLVIIDLDYFKKINDTYGHQAGDEVLRRAANAINQCLRDSDISARIGGEEFACILPETSATEAVHLAQRIHSAIRECVVNYKGNEIHLTASMGLADRKDPEMTIDQVITRADEAMYEAKQKGRNQIVTFV